MEESGKTGEGRRLATGPEIGWPDWSSPVFSWAIVLLSAGLYTLAFPPFPLAEAAYVFAVPILAGFAFLGVQRFSFLQFFIGGWLSWIVLIFWLRHFTSHLTFFLAPILSWGAMLALAAVLGLFWAAWFAAARYVFERALKRTTLVRVLSILGLASLWVVLEWVRTWLFTGFPWLPLAVSQWDRSLILQISSLTGQWGVSFVLIAFNLGLGFYLWRLWYYRRQRWWVRLSPEFYSALGILFAAIGFGLYSAGELRQQTEVARFAFVQPNLRGYEKWDPAKARESFDVLEEMTELASYLKPDVILWPESPTPLPVKGNDSVRDWVESLSTAVDTPILMGNMAMEESEDTANRWYNTVFWVGPEEGARLDDYYRKRHLVPFGEYVPLSGVLPFIRKVVPLEGQFFPGDSANLITARIKDDDIDFAPLICYEDIFPSLARESVRKGGDIFYVATNNTWFGEEGGAYQHAAHSVLRAVETRRPVLRCGNAGWSGWIDEFGHTRHFVGNDTGSIYFQGADAVDVSWNPVWRGKQTLYVVYGDWLVYLSIVLVVINFIYLRMSSELPPGERLRPERQDKPSLKPRFSLRK